MIRFLEGWLRRPPKPPLPPPTPSAHDEFMAAGFAELRSTLQFLNALRDAHPADLGERHAEAQERTIKALKRLEQERYGKSEETRP